MGIFLGRFKILWLILSNELLVLLVEDGRGTGESARKRERERGCEPTGTKGSFRYRVIYPVTKGDTFGTTLRAPVGEPGLKLVFNRYLKLFL